MEFKTVKEMIHWLKENFDELIKYDPEIDDEITGVIKLNLGYLHKTKWGDITALPDNIGKLVNLKNLYLYRLQLSDLPESFGNLQKLEVIELQGNSFSFFPKPLTKLKNLKTLRLYGNKISDIPDEISNLTSLEEVYLNDNNFTSIPLSLYTLKNLDLVYLDGNKIKEIPSEIGLYTHLKSISSLSGNEIKEIPPEIGQLKNLEHFRVDENELIGLPKEIGLLKKLEAFYLSDNQISELPDEFCDLSSLNHLELKNNRLKFLPEDWAKLKLLNWLDLRNNELREFPINLPNELNYKREYPSLEISGNNIQALADDFINYSSIFDSVKIDLDLALKLEKPLGHYFDEDSLILYLKINEKEYDSAISVEWYEIPLREWKKEWLNEVDDEDSDFYHEDSENIKIILEYILNYFETSQ